jgi:hypothetical protein
MIVKFLAVVSLIGSTAWMLAAPGYEPALAIVGSLITLIATIAVERRAYTRASQRQTVSKNSIGIQAGGDVTLDSMGRDVINNTGIVTVGQVGDNTINQRPDPPVGRTLSAVSKDQGGGTFIHQIIFQVIAPYPPASMDVEVTGGPMIDTLSTVGATGLNMINVLYRNENRFIQRIPSPHGQYTITVHSKSSEMPKANISFN